MINTKTARINKTDNLALPFELTWRNRKFKRFKNVGDAVTWAFENGFTHYRLNAKIYPLVIFEAKKVF